METRLAALALVALWLSGAKANPFGSTFAGDGTYYGYRDRGFGHCSFHFHGFGTSPGYAGVPLAINSAQYTGTSVCGLDQCPECKYGDVDLQKGGDGRWKVEWEPVQCPVGSSTFKFGFQGGNPYYKKIQVANARVPIESVQIKRNGAWQQLVKTIDNYHEYHGGEGEAWNDGGCAWLRLRSILGDVVEDRICCTSGTCTGGAQLPCRADMPGCSGAGGGGSSSGGGGSGGDMSNKRYATGTKQLLAGDQCGGTGFGCSSAGKDQCQDKAYSRAKCARGLKCVRNDARWWGCKQA